MPEDYSAATGVSQSSGTLFRADERVDYSKSGGAGAHASTQTTTKADGSSETRMSDGVSGSGSREAWTKSDGTAGFTARDVAARTTAVGWISADGSAGLDAAGNRLRLGSAAADTLSGGAGNDFLAGAAGDDRIVLGGGIEMVGFNRGDGHDTVVLGSTGGDAVSLGGEISVADLVLSRAGNDLVLSLGEADSLSFADWYAQGSSRGIATLQLVTPALRDEALGNAAPAESYDFQRLVALFDAARAADANLAAWQASDALTPCRLNDTPEHALGGDIAIHYGRHRGFSGFGMSLGQANLAAAGFLTSPQAVGGEGPAGGELVRLR